MVDVASTADLAALAARVARLEAGTNGVQAARIADFLERFGVNTFSSLDPASNVWGSYPADYSPASVIAGLQWLTAGSGLCASVREYHYAGRESIQATWCPAVAAATGARFSMCIGAQGTDADVPSLMALATSSAGSTGWLQYVEGINEPNNFTVPSAMAVTVQQDIETSAKALAGAAHPPLVVGPSAVFGLPAPAGYITPSYFSAAQMTSVTAASAISNAHIYPPANPNWDDGSGVGTMDQIVAGFRIAYGPQPILCTEWNSTLYNQQGHKLDPAYDAYYALLFMLAAWRVGLLGWFWYALLDYGTTYLSGLFPQKGAVAPRPVAYAIRALYALTGDHGANKRTFQPGSLGFVVSGLPLTKTNGGGQVALFQASDGRFFALISNEQSAPGGAPTPVVVTFARPMSSVADYKISTGSLTCTTPVQALTNASSITVALDASVHLLVIAP
jgi:hypothetical protein